MIDSQPGKPIDAIQAPIAALGQIFSALMNTSERCGLSESKWHLICTEHAEAQCELCGIKISGSELTQLANARSKEELPAAKLQRLHFQYCARQGCESRYYRFNLLAHPQVDWTLVKQSLENSISLLPSEMPRPALVKLKLNGRLVALSVLMTAAILISVVLLRHWIYGSRIPLIQQRHHYQTNPSTDSNGNWR